MSRKKKVKASESDEPKELSAKVTLRLHPERSMFLREGWGSGKLGDRDISFGRILPATLYVEYRDRIIALDTESLCRAAADLVDRELDS